MARSKVLSGNGEFVHHVNAVRARLTGTGSFHMQLNSLDNIYTSTLVPFVMSPTTNIEPTRLANFKSQRVQLECRTIGINEFVYKCNRIIIFAKPVEADLPSYLSP